MENIATEVRKVVKGTGYRLEMFSENGDKTLDDRDARRFFLKPSNVMITLDETLKTIKLHKPDSVELEQIDSLRKTLQSIATKNRWNFDLRTFGHTLKPKDYVHQAVKSMNDEELAMKNMAEGMSPMSGSSKSSYQLHDNKVKLIVRHTKPIDEEVRGSRSRHIKALFIENGAGERFQYPHKHLAGARAMARHVSMGGITHDEVGQHITSLSEEYAQVQKFLRYARSPKFVSEETGNAVDAVKERYINIKEQLAALTSVKNYGQAVESIDATERETTDEKVTELKDMFTTREFPESLEESLPLISKIIEHRHKADDPSQMPVGPQLDDLPLMQRKVDEVEFHDQSAGQQEYASANIEKWANSKDQLRYQIAELSGIVKDHTLSSFLGRFSMRIGDEREFKEFQEQLKKEFPLVQKVLNIAEKEGVFDKKDSAGAEVDDTDNEFAKQDQEEMPDNMYAPEGRQFESWLEDIASDKALFETVEVAEDEFVDFSRAVADAKERMSHLPRMTDGSPLIRKIKGMCEEVATEYNLTAEDIYSALSGEDVINEGEPRQMGDPKKDVMVVQLTGKNKGKTEVVDRDSEKHLLAKDGQNKDWGLAESEIYEDNFSEAEITVNEDIPLAGDSIWMDEEHGISDKIKSVHVASISIRTGDEDDEDDETISVYVTHDGPYQIYTDSGFAEAISTHVSEHLGKDTTVKWSEQGMQEDGQAHLEGYLSGESEYVDYDGTPMTKAEWEANPGLDDDYDPLDRVKQLAGVKPVTEDGGYRGWLMKNPGATYQEFMKVFPDAGITPEGYESAKDEWLDRDPSVEFEPMESMEIDEAQSEAQKAAFQKMLDGKKEETTEETETDDKDEDEVSETLDRVKHLAGV